MIRFFDYVFYRLYIWNRWLDKLFMEIFPVQSDALFTALLGLSVAQTMNLFVLSSGLLLLLGGRQYLYFTNYILYGFTALTFLGNYLYYWRSGKYKFVFSKERGNTKSNFWVISYVLVSVTLLAFMILLIRWLS